MELYQQFHADRKYRDKSFTYLKINDLRSPPSLRHDIDGNNVYAIVSQMPTKHLDSTAWEYLCSAPL